MRPLPPKFYLEDVTRVARALLGQRLVRRLENGGRLAGYIVETEAYDGEEDKACHASHGRTPRNAVMFGPPGRAYVYFTYGMHWCLNAVVGPEGQPAAVLIRAIVPCEGVEQIARNRAGRPPEVWTNGPAKVCQALQIDGRLNGCDLTMPGSPLSIEPGFVVPEAWVQVGPRVGIAYAPEPWRSMPWRFIVHLPDEAYTAWGIPPLVWPGKRSPSPRQREARRGAEG
ncbi:DNA-3-methyladenine glycosylase [uncultured Thermanaerothrix sp.]|uniref:DNA-3-methyladenine glycosylase n=1 Tax=uncultured Thermanaerothrix sp. TaxID=1195149 RepID=UPI002614458E|nr:DNA-3-methyladenine glycosylase [uncultured Thermanaerothrix sp.]